MQAVKQQVFSQPDPDPVPQNENMQKYYDGGGGGGCFDGNCLVALDDGRAKLVKDIQKGDRLKNSGVVVSVIKIVG